MTESKSTSSDEGKEYVVVKASDDTSPASEIGTDAKVEDKEEDGSVTPEILYKVQYKDYSGRL
jgi:hypothetical protein